MRIGAAYGTVLSSKITATLDSWVFADDAVRKKQRAGAYFRELTMALTAEEISESFFRRVSILRMECSTVV